VRRVQVSTIAKAKAVMNTVLLVVVAVLFEELFKKLVLDLECHENPLIFDGLMRPDT